MDMILQGNHICFAVLAVGLDGEDIPIIPVSIVDLGYGLGTRMKQIFGFHDIVDDGVDGDGSGQVDDRHIDNFEFDGSHYVEVLKVEVV